MLDKARILYRIIIGKNNKQNLPVPCAISETTDQSILSSFSHILHLLELELCSLQNNLYFICTI